MSDGNVPLPRAEAIDEVEQANIFVIDDDTGESVQPLVADGRLLVETLLGDKGVTLETEDPISDQGSGSGVSNGVELDLGGRFKDFDLYYDVDAAGSIVIEVSTDGDTWRPFIDHDADGEEILQERTTFSYVRAYADAGDFDDGEVNTLEISAKE